MHIIVYASATATSGINGGDAVEMPLDFLALNCIGMNLPAVTTSIEAISRGRMIELGATAGIADRDTFHCTSRALQLLTCNQRTS
jgi:hypothetical protein